MIGAIVGDVIGSRHESTGIKTKDFDLFSSECRFTDDSVLTIAVAHTLMSGCSYVEAFHNYFEAYPTAGYGFHFTLWAGRKEKQPYNSWGNGAAMRVSPVAYAFRTLEEILVEAQRSAEVTHNHPEGIRGAQATAAAVFLARQKKTRSEIRDFLEMRFGYNLHQSLADIRPSYRFDESCQGTVPQAIISFLESDHFEDSIRNAVSLGGDADTLACITGGIAEAHYGGVPSEIIKPALGLLDHRLREVALKFHDEYCVPTA